MKRSEVSHPIFSWIYRRLGGCDRRALGKHREYLTGLASGRVLELGCGAGFNFPFYLNDGSVDEVVAIEPDKGMLKGAINAANDLAKNKSVPIRVEHGDAHGLNFPDHSFDCAISTLVLCTVEDPQVAVGELRRVIKPGGKLIFLEHVRASSGGWNRVQRFLDPVWKRVAGGCRLCRDTKATILGAGFTLEKCDEAGYIGSPLLPIILGVAKN